MAKKIEIDSSKFIWAWEAKNDFGNYRYSIAQIALDFKIGKNSVTTYRKFLGLSERGRGNFRNKKGK